MASLFKKIVLGPSIHIQTSLQSSRHRIAKSSRSSKVCHGIFPGFSPPSSNGWQHPLFTELELTVVKRGLNSWPLETCRRPPTRHSEAEENGRDETAIVWVENKPHKWWCNLKCHRILHLQESFLEYFLTVYLYHKPVHQRLFESNCAYSHQIAARASQIFP